MTTQLHQYGNSSVVMATGLHNYPHLQQQQQHQRLTKSSEGCLDSSSRPQQHQGSHHLPSWWPARGGPQPQLLPQVNAQLNEAHQNFLRHHHNGAGFSGFPLADAKTPAFHQLMEEQQRQQQQQQQQNQQHRQYEELLLQRQLAHSLSLHTHQQENELMQKLHQEKKMQQMQMSKQMQPPQNPYTGQSQPQLAVRQQVVEPSVSQTSSDCTASFQHLNANSTSQTTEGSGKRSSPSQDQTGRRLSSFRRGRMVRASTKRFSSTSSSSSSSLSPSPSLKRAEESSPEVALSPQSQHCRHEDLNSSSQWQGRGDMVQRQHHQHSLLHHNHHQTQPLQGLGLRYALANAQPYQDNKYPCQVREFQQQPHNQRDPQYPNPQAQVQTYQFSHQGAWQNSCPSNNNHLLQLQQRNAPLAHQPPYDYTPLGPKVVPMEHYQMNMWQHEQMRQKELQQHQQQSLHHQQQYVQMQSSNSQHQHQENEDDIFAELSEIISLPDELSYELKNGHPAQQAMNYYVNAEEQGQVVTQAHPCSTVASSSSVAPGVPDPCFGSGELSESNSSEHHHFQHHHHLHHETPAPEAFNYLYQIPV